MRTEKVTIPAVDGSNLVGIVALPEDEGSFPAVISCHGFSSGKNNATNQAFEPRLTAAGIALVRFDFRGHGDSDGELVDVTLDRGIEDVGSIVEYALSQTWLDRSRLAGCGSSFGGASMLGYAAEHEVFSCLGLKVPAIDMAEAREQRLTSEEMAKWERDGFMLLPDDQAKNGYQYHLAAKAHDLYAAGAKITCPTLIVHGDADDSVPYQQAVKLAAAMKGVARLETISGANHRFTQPADFDAMVDHLCTFFEHHLLSGN